MSLHANGCIKLPFDPRVADWAAQATALVPDIVGCSAHLRHGGTWFPGIDALPNGVDGALGGVPLRGPWQAHVPDLPLHPAQLSIVYPGYPRQDAGESDAAHRYRRVRGAAHVDGLLPEGPDKRRFAREYHAYILGIPLNTCACAPTLMWPGSHRIIGDMLREALANTKDAAAVDITEAYHAARRAVFETTDPVPLQGAPGESFLIHRHALHGTAAWDGLAFPEGRMVAFFRPEFETVAAWLAP